jgi:hypothetical protein
MRPVLTILICLCALHPALAQLRRPSCEALIAFVFSGRPSVVEQSFGRTFDAMTVDEFNQALDIASDCVDQVEAAPPDVPGLLPRELKRTQLQMLTVLIEDLHYYRNQRRERDQRSVRR